MIEKPSSHFLIRGEKDSKWILFEILCTIYDFIVIR